MSDKGMSTHAGILAWRSPWTDLSGSQQIRLANTSLGIQFNSNQWQPQTVHHIPGVVRTSRNFWKRKVIMLPELTEMIAFSKSSQLHLSSARQSPPPFSIAHWWALLLKWEKRLKVGVGCVEWIESLRLADANQYIREGINNSVLLYSTGHAIQYPIINHNGKEYICITESL